MPKKCYALVMSDELLDMFPTIVMGLDEIADPERRGPMQAYMRDQFEFLGVASPDRRAVSKSAITLAKRSQPDELIAFARLCWAQAEREFQNIGADVLRAGAEHLGPNDLPAVRELIESKSWWDTIDSLAPWTVGVMVRNHTGLSAEMDVWIDDPNIWVARSAILHQLSYKAETDADRLFRYVESRAADQEFFIRKACGWALRQYARVDGDAVRNFVAAHDDDLSGLTKREALKHLNRE